MPIRQRKLFLLEPIPVGKSRVDIRRCHGCKHPANDCLESRLSVVGFLGGSLLASAADWMSPPKCDFLNLYPVAKRGGDDFLPRRRWFQALFPRNRVPAGRLEKPIKSVGIIVVCFFESRRAKSTQTAKIVPLGDEVRKHWRLKRAVERLGIDDCPDGRLEVLSPGVVAPIGRFSHDQKVPLERCWRALRRFRASNLREPLLSPQARA